MTLDRQDVWITGIGLASSLGEGHEAHWARLGGHEVPRPVVDEATYAPYPVHPLVQLDFSKQIPKRSDQKQMEAWQRIGTYAAGLALADADIAKQPELLDRTSLVVAAGSGERDTQVDRKVLEAIGAGAADTDLLAKQVLPSALRPTLFLAQLSNLLAGNISIIHNVTGSSRTFMGEEMAGIAAVENAFRRIRNGQGELFLVGGACNAEREDLLLGFELGRMLWCGPFKPVWQRRGERGGMVLGSVGAFLVLEARAHAEARGTKPYARIVGVASDRSSRAPGRTRETVQRLLEGLSVGLSKGPLGVLSGASGVEPVLSEELAFLEALGGDGNAAAIRAYGTMLGHSVEAHFPAGVALAALALSKGSFLASCDATGVERPFTGPTKRILVTGLGHWRGEGLALLEAPERSDR